MKFLGNDLIYIDHFAVRGGAKEYSLIHTRAESARVQNYTHK